MSYYAHNAVIVTINGYMKRYKGNIFEDLYMPDVEAFRESLPEKWRHLLVGPVQSVVNDYISYAFLPDGSGEGWTDSDDGDKYRDEFADLFDQQYDDGSSPFSVVWVRFGGDEPEKTEAGGNGLAHIMLRLPPDRPDEEE